MSPVPDPAAIARPWISAYPPGVPPTYDVPKVALGRFLDDAARDFGEHPALVTSVGTVGHVTLRDRVDAVATVLGELGIVPGERVLVALPNHEAAPVVLFALWRLGAVVVTVSSGLSVDRMAAIVADAEPAAAVADDATLHAMEAQGDLLPPVAVAVDGREWHPRRRWSVRRRSADDEGGTVSLGARLRSLGGRRDVPAGPVFDDLALLDYRADANEGRGVALTHANLVTNAFQCRLWIPDVQAGKERLLVADPLHDPVALLGLLTGLLAAATVVLLDEPDAGELGVAVAGERPTLLVARPRRLADLADAPGRRDLRSLRVCLSVGGPMETEAAVELERRTDGARVREAYGLREASALTHAQPVYGRVEGKSMGLPVTDTVGLVVDPDDHSRRCEPGAVGLLLVAGPQVAAGYWRRPEETAARFHDGWLVTGDVATASAEGTFDHVGRADEVVRREDQLVALPRLERVLEDHQDVERAGVIVLDGPALVAAVTRRRRHRLDTDDVLAHCREHLEPAAVPDRIEVVDEVPTHRSGAVERVALRRRLLGR